MRENMKIYAHTHAYRRNASVPLSADIDEAALVDGWLEGGENAESSQCKRAMEPKQANKQTYKNHFPSLLSRHGKMSNVKHRGDRGRGSRHTTISSNNTEPHK